MQFWWNCTVAWSGSRAVSCLYQEAHAAVFACLGLGLQSAPVGRKANGALLRLIGVAAAACNCLLQVLKLDCGRQAPPPEMWSGLSGLTSLQWLCLRWLDTLPAACLAPLTGLVALQLKAITVPPGELLLLGVACCACAGTIDIYSGSAAEGDKGSARWEQCVVLLRGVLWALWGVIWKAAW